MDKMKILSGYSKVDITPDFAIGLGGYGNDANRVHEAVLDRIYGICLALTDVREQTVLLYSVDLLLVDETLTNKLRSAVNFATGVPKEQIFLAATHNHSGPSSGISVQYTDLFVKRMTQAAEEALADCALSSLKIGRCKTEKLNYTRHYMNMDGSYFGDNFGTRMDPVAGHAGEPDEEIQLIRFERESKRDILLVNWQAHAKMCSTATSEFGKIHHKHLSADFIGYARDALEQKTGAEVIYFSGAAGNLNPDSRIEQEAPPKEPDLVGQMLAEFAAKGLDAMETISAGDICCQWETLSVPIDHSDDDKIQLAKSIWSLWSADPVACKERAKAAGFNSAYAARDVIRRYELEGSRKMELGILKIGEIAFVAVPYEMFCENGRYVKENSPFAMTVIMSCTNAYHKYIPSDRAFDHGCYEVDSRLYPRGTAEHLSKVLVDCLRG